MQVSFSSKSYTPSFGIFFHNVENQNGKLHYRGDTRICRDDIYFPEVIDYLDNKYKNVPKVNVLMHACSDGEEVYSFLGVLISRLRNKAIKFLPVTAKDIDSEHLQLAKKGIYDITNSEYQCANEAMNGDFDSYFEQIPLKKIKDPRIKYSHTFKVNPDLKTLVNFEQGDILKDVNKVNFKNTVLFARNFWPYLGTQEIKQLAHTLSQKMDNSSTLIIGDFDKEYGIDEVLRSEGFVETHAENVFEKPRSECYKDYNVGVKKLHR